MGMGQVFKNNAATTLNGAITNSATTITVTDGSVFPTPNTGEWFWATLTQAGNETSWEVVQVTARSGNNLTVVRGQQGTSAAAFNSGDKIELRLTAQDVASQPTLIVKAVATGNVTLSGPGSTIDGVSMSTGDLFLAPSQTTGSENGVYVWNGAASAATRHYLASQGSQFPGMKIEAMEGGTSYPGTQWRCINSSIPTVGSTTINFDLYGVIFTATASAGPSNTVSETSFFGSGRGTLTLPKNFFTVGKTLRLRLRIYFTTVSSPTLDIRFKLGGTVVASTGATTYASVSGSILVDVEATCRTTGPTGTLFIEGGAARFSATGTGFAEMKNTATTTVDTTAALAVDMTGVWGTASASNTATCPLSYMEGPR